MFSKIVIKQNDEPDPRIVNAMFGGIADNNKEVTVNCNIMQAGNPEESDYPTGDPTPTPDPKSIDNLKICIK